MCLKIPSYVINLKKRTDRLSHIRKEFSDKSEFSVHLIRAIEDPIPAVGLYRSLHLIITEAKDQNLSFVVICEDDHQFTQHYSSRKLQKHISFLKERNADLLLGGVSWFDTGVRVKDGIYWTRNFTGTQFLVVFSSFYERILETHFGSNDNIDRWLSNLSDSIFVVVPMISVQHDFGYSDVTPKNNALGIVDNLFVKTSARWDAYEKIYSHIKRSQVIDKLSDCECDKLQLSVYMICLNERLYELDRVKREFREKFEFELFLINDKQQGSEIFRIWRSVKKAVKLAKERGDEVMLLCNSEHTFSSVYNKQILFSAIYQGAYLGADIVLGGVYKTYQAVPVNDYLCWIDFFQNSQFIVIYSHFFQTILKENFTDQDLLGPKLSGMTANKYVIHPFISIEKDFNFSENLSDDSFMNYSVFSECSEKQIDLIRQKYSQFKLAF